MKKLSLVISALFFIMAAALGWFLPVAAFNFEDKFYEGKQAALDIEQINLSYREDLAMNQKINMVKYDINISENIGLEKGVFSTKEDIERIISEFMVDFTGYKHDVSYSLYAKPMLVNLSNNRGTIVIWFVNCWIAGDWSFECCVDDKTGAILRCSFASGGSPWDDLVSGASSYNDMAKSLTERISNALYNHYQKQVSAKLVTYRKIQDLPLENTVGYRLVFRDAKNYTFQVTVNAYVNEGRIETI